MTTSFTLPKFLIFGIPLLMVLSMVILVNLPAYYNHQAELSTAIIIDLAFSTPLVYFLLIRKQPISKLTIVPIFILGLVVASFIIPKDQQSLLTLIKTWVVPVVELGVLTLIFIKIKKARKSYKSARTSTIDTFNAIKRAAKEVIPSKASILLATEIAVFYYGFLAWKKPTLSDYQFTYHKRSGIIALYAILIGIILVETTAFHFLLAQWSHLAAWILTGLSIYTAIQVYGMTRAIYYRPFNLTETSLHLPYGLFNETTIELATIESIEIIKKMPKKEEDIQFLSILPDFEKPNILISLNTQNTLHKLYGFTKNYTSLAFFIDEPQRLKNKIENKQDY